MAENEESSKNPVTVETPEPTEEKLPNAKPQAEDEDMPDAQHRKAAKSVYHIFEYVEMFAMAVAVVVILISFFFRLTVVVGESMEKTLIDGQVLVISNLFYEPATDDIIVIQPMTDDYTSPIVKRVIATEGQVVDIDFETWTVSVDGTVLAEDYVNRPDSDVAMSGSYLDFPYTVPDGMVFVMGDNRNHSTDSRDIRFGPLDERYILGKVLLRIFPLNVAGTVE